MAESKGKGKETPFPLPVIFTNGGEWVEAWCPVIDVATQGKTHEEAEKNIKELIGWYFEDKDTPKPKLDSLMSLSVSVSRFLKRTVLNPQDRGEAICVSRKKKAEA